MGCCFSKGNTANTSNDTETRNARIVKPTAAKASTRSAASWCEPTPPKKPVNRGKALWMRQLAYDYAIDPLPAAPPNSLAAQQTSSNKGGYPYASDMSQSAWQPTNWVGTTTTTSAPPQSIDKANRAPQPQHGKGKSNPSPSVPGGFNTNPRQHLTEPGNFKPAYRIKRRELKQQFSSL